MSQDMETQMASAASHLTAGSDGEQPTRARTVVTPNLRISRDVPEIQFTWTVTDGHLDDSLTWDVGYENFVAPSVTNGRVDGPELWDVGYENFIQPWYEAWAGTTRNPVVQGWLPIRTQAPTPLLVNPLRAPTPKDIAREIKQYLEAWAAEAANQALCASASLAKGMLKARRRQYAKVKNFFYWKFRRANDTKRISKLRFTKNGIYEAATNLTIPNKRRELSEHKPEGERPLLAMQWFMERHGFPTVDIDRLCLRVTLGRTIPGAAGLRESDEEIIEKLKQKPNEHALFKCLATRLALKDLDRLGSEVWEEYQKTDHYAANFINWWGNIKRRKKRLSAAIHPEDEKVTDEARKVLYSMLHIAHIVATDATMKYAKLEQVKAKIVTDLEKNFQGYVSLAGSYVAACWAADIACAIREERACF